MAVYYPPVGFHFKVTVLGLPAVDDDVRFTEVGGLAAEIATEEMPEGGENRFVQKYPLRTKYSELVLKRGLLLKSAVLDWVLASLTADRLEPKDLDVMLLDEEHQPLFTWHVFGAFPTKWAVADLNASSNAVAVESLQLAYQYFTVDRA